jgi:hypothetical protein
MTAAEPQTLQTPTKCKWAIIPGNNNQYLEWIPDQVRGAHLLPIERACPNKRCGSIRIVR